MLAWIAPGSGLALFGVSGRFRRRPNVDAQLRARADEHGGTATARRRRSSSAAAVVGRQAERLVGGQVDACHLVFCLAGSAPRGKAVVASFWTSHDESLSMSRTRRRNLARKGPPSTSAGTGYRLPRTDEGGSRGSAVDEHVASPQTQEQLPEDSPPPDGGAAARPVFLVLLIGQIVPFLFAGVIVSKLSSGKLAWPGEMLFTATLLWGFGGALKMLIGGEITSIAVKRLNEIPWGEKFPIRFGRTSKGGGSFSYSEFHEALANDDVRLCETFSRLRRAAWMSSLATWFGIPALLSVTGTATNDDAAMSFPILLTAGAAYVWPKVRLYVLILRSLRE